MSKFHAIYGKGGVSPEPAGDIHGEVQTLLWTNSSPTNEFSPQKISLDLSNYDGVIIEVSNGTTHSNGCLAKIPKDNPLTLGTGVTESVNAISRNITAIDNTGITFDAGKNGGDVANQFMIPVNIWGYKQYETGTISGAAQMSFQQNVEFDIGIGNYCVTNISSLSNANVTPSVGEVICSSKYTESNVHIYTQLIKSVNGKVKMPYNGVYNVVVVG